MSSHDTRSRDDAEFDLFLNRSGELSQQLQSLPQPEPSAELDATILAQAERNLAGGSRLLSEASNDAFIPGAPPILPTFFRRMQVPMGLAASVMVAILVTLQWQGPSPSDMPVLVAQAPQAEEWPEPRAAASVAKRPPAVPAESPTAPPPAWRPKTDARELNRQESAEQRESEQIMIAQAEMAERERRASRSPAPVDSAPAAASVPSSTPPVSKLIKVPPAHDAKPWLALIDELWKADLQREAVEEWKKFQKSYPDYPVPEKLKKALNEAAKEQAAR